MPFKWKANRFRPLIVLLAQIQHFFTLDSLSVAHSPSIGFVGFCLFAFLPRLDFALYAMKWDQFDEHVAHTYHAALFSSDKSTHGQFTFWYGFFRLHCEKSAKKTPLSASYRRVLLWVVFFAPSFTLLLFLLPLTIVYERARTKKCFVRPETWFNTVCDLFRLH